MLDDDGGNDIATLEIRGMWQTIFFFIIIKISFNCGLADLLPKTNASTCIKTIIYRGINTILLWYIIMVRWVYNDNVVYMFGGSVCGVLKCSITCE